MKFTVFMYVKYPEANGPKRIINILQSHKIDVYCSYDINDLDENQHNILIIPGGTAMKQQTDLGPTGIDRIKQFVHY